MKRGQRTGAASRNGISSDRRCRYAVRSWIASQNLSSASAAANGVGVLQRSLGNPHYMYTSPLAHLIIFCLSRYPAYRHSIPTDRTTQRPEHRHLVPIPCHLNPTHRRRRRPLPANRSTRRPSRRWSTTGRSHARGRRRPRPLVRRPRRRRARCGGPAGHIEVRQRRFRTRPAAADVSRCGRGRREAERGTIMRVRAMGLWRSVARPGGR